MARYGCCFVGWWRGGGEPSYESTSVPASIHIDEVNVDIYTCRCVHVLSACVYYKKSSETKIQSVVAVNTKISRSFVICSRRIQAPSLSLSLLFFSHKMCHLFFPPFVNFCWSSALLILKIHNVLFEFANSFMTRLNKLAGT